MRFCTVLPPLCSCSHLLCLSVAIISNKVRTNLSSPRHDTRTPRLHKPRPLHHDHILRASCYLSTVGPSPSTSSGEGWNLIPDVGYHTLLAERTGTLFWKTNVRKVVVQGTNGERLNVDLGRSVMGGGGSFSFRFFFALSWVGLFVSAVCLLF